MTVQQNQSTEKKKEMVNASTDYDKLRDRGFMSRTGEAFAAFLGIFDAAGGIAALLSKEEINHPAVQEVKRHLVGPTLYTRMYKIYSYNAWTVPSAPFMGSYDGRILSLLFPLVGGIITTAEMLTTSMAAPQEQPTFRNGKIFIPGLHAATVYASRRMFEIMSDDELVAVFLHELGHNTMGKRTAILSLLSNFVVPGSLILPLTLPCLVVAIFILMMYRSMEYKADRAATLCGYGPALQRALTKLRSYTMGTASFKASGFNVLEQIHNIVNFVGTYTSNALSHVFRLGIYPSFGHRHTAIDTDMEERRADIQSKRDVTLADTDFSPAQAKALNRVDVVAATAIERLAKYQPAPLQ